MLWINFIFNADKKYLILSNFFSSLSTCLGDNLSTVGVAGDSATAAYPTVGVTNLETRKSAILKTRGKKIRHLKN
jgi:hypothetical protein